LRVTRSQPPTRGCGNGTPIVSRPVEATDTEGNLEVPRVHVETMSVETAEGSGGGAGEGGGVVEVRLGEWVNNQCTRRSSLNEERVRLLTGLGMRW